jgi:hypothetical protein
MLLTMGIVDFSLAIWEYNTISFLAREGARYGIAPSKTTAEIEAYVFSRAVLPDFNATACAGRSPACVVVARGTCGVVADPVVVTVNYPYSAASGMIASLTGGTINLQASASMYVEKGAAGLGACP